MTAATPDLASTLPPALAEVLHDLAIPETDARLTRVTGHVGTTLLVLPAPDRPQLLVPLTRAGAVLVAERRSGGRLGKLTKQTLAAVLGAGLGRLLPVPRLLVRGSALTDLSRLASGGACDSAGIMLGPPRANRKPVLRLFDESGETWGYAKVGINDLTDDLIATEAAQLATVNAIVWRTLRPPRVLVDDTWQGHRVLTTAPLAGTGAERQPAHLPIAATRELLSHSAGTLSLAEALTALGDSSVRDGSGAGERSRHLLERTVTLWGDRALPMAASHGDWTPWNMAYAAGSGTGDRILDVWDWERFDPARPAGFDIVHFACSTIDAAAASSAADPGQPALQELPRLFNECGLDDEVVAPSMAAYLLLIAHRYAADLVREPVPALVRRHAWALDLLDAHLRAHSEEHS